MKLILQTVFLMVVLHGCSASEPEDIYAKASMTTINSFTELEAIVEQHPHEVGSTLIVMDDDDTLTMMPCSDTASPARCQYLGGPAWFTWQRAMIEADSKSSYRVARNQGELLNISAQLLAMNEMVYTDPSIPSVLSNFSRRGAKFLVLTARGSANLSATEHQFSNLSGGPQQSLLSLISTHGLRGNESGVSSIASPLIKGGCPLQRDVTYQQGVMYVAGQNKGAMLKCLLRRTRSNTIKRIVFIDDTEGNVKDVYQAFVNDQQYEVTAIHYTRLNSHKAALTNPPINNPLQIIANERWQAINRVLHKQLIAPSIEY